MALVVSSIPHDNNGHHCSGIFSGKTEKMAAGCDDFSVIFGIYSQVFYCLITENKHFHNENGQCLP